MSSNTPLEIVLIRQELLAIREQMLRSLDALDQRLASMEPEAPSFQIPRDRKKAMAEYLGRP